MDWLLFIILVSAFFYKFRKSAEVHFPIVMFKTERLVNDVWRIGRKHKKFFNTLGDLAILAALIIMPLSLYMIGKSGYDVMTIPEMKSPIAPVVPGVRLPGSDVFIPLWQGVIAMLVLGTVHELSHGLVASAQGTKPKSIVMIFITVLASFGVELNDRDVKRMPLRQQLRIFAAGSFANFVTAIVFAALLIGLSHAVAPNIVPLGMEIVEIAKGSPAEGKLSVGDYILELNGTDANDYASFVNASLSLLPNEPVKILTNKGEITLQTTVHKTDPSRGRIGVISSPKVKIKHELFMGPIIWIIQLFNWIVGLNLSVGALNLLPLPPFDGGRMVGLTAEKFKHKGPFKKLIYATTFVFLMINIFGGFIKGL